MELGPCWSGVQETQPPVGSTAVGTCPVAPPPPLPPSVAPVTTLESQPPLPSPELLGTMTSSGSSASLQGAGYTGNQEEVGNVCNSVGLVNKYYINDIFFPFIVTVFEKHEHRGFINKIICFKGP